MLPEAKIKRIDDVSGMALPLSTDQHGYAKGAATHDRFGPGAMNRMLKAATEIVTMPDRACMVLFEVAMI